MKLHSAIALMALLSNSILAQQNKNGLRKEKIESQRIAFITHHLDLSPDEAKNFWPVYNQYRHGLKQIRLEKKRAISQNGSEENVSEKSMEENLVKDFELQQKNLDLKKLYYSRFKEVLPVKKVVKLYKVERKFKDGMALHRAKGKPVTEGKF